MQLLEFIGQPPSLDGKTCEGFICEGFESMGESVGTANVTYLKFEGRWHRLCFDPGTVHWRVSLTPPASWEVTEEGWNYPHVDVGLDAGIVGVRLNSYCTSATERGVKVIFNFANARKVVIENRDDQSTYQVI